MKNIYCKFSSAGFTTAACTAAEWMPELLGTQPEDWAEYSTECLAGVDDWDIPSLDAADLVRDFGDLVTPADLWRGAGSLEEVLADPYAAEDLAQIICAKLYSAGRAVDTFGGSVLVRKAG